MKIQVAQEHIDRARQLYGRRTEVCPIALAMKDAGMEGAYVTGTWAWDANAGYKLSDEACEFVNRYDSKEPVEPTEVRMIRCFEVGDARSAGGQGRPGGASSRPCASCHPS